jgi:hypothetical protein
LRPSSTGISEGAFRELLPAVRSARRVELSTGKAIARSTTSCELSDSDRIVVEGPRAIGGSQPPVSVCEFRGVSGQLTCASVGRTADMVGVSMSRSVSRSDGLATELETTNHRRAGHRALTVRSRRGARESALSSGSDLRRGKASRWWCVRVSSRSSTPASSSLPTPSGAGPTTDLVLSALRKSDARARRRAA